MSSISVETQYLIIVTSLLILPKLLLRFRVPSGITCLFLGCLCANLLGWFKDDQLILMLARLGITSLFLFAGMEIELDDLKPNAVPLTKHLIKFITLITLISVGFYEFMEISFQSALLVAIAVMTPSAGFIFSSLQSYELTEKEVYWIKLKAITQEMAAIVLLLLSLQIDSLRLFFQTQGVIFLMILLLPVLIKAFLRYVAPFAPKSEVSFLIIVAFVSGVITKKLGTHYLVGAFITGVAAGQFTHFMKSREAARILDSLSSFFYVFVPFYFFKAGLSLSGDMLLLPGLVLGLIISAGFIPFRIWSVALSVKHFLKDSSDHRHQIAIALAPNLIFGLVVVGILREKGEVEPILLSALIVYTILASILPSLYFKKIPPENYDLSRYSLAKN